MRYDLRYDGPVGRYAVPASRGRQFGATDADDVDTLKRTIFRLQAGLNAAQAELSAARKLLVQQAASIAAPGVIEGGAILRRLGVSAEDAAKYGKRRGGV